MSPAGGASGPGSPAVTEERPGRLTYFDLPPTPATARVLHRDAGRRAGRALAALALCWALAAVSVLVPIAHFLLVPGFLVLGVVLAVLRLREQATLVSARGACPGCGREQEFRIGARLGAEHGVDCPGCRRGLRLVLEETAR